MNEIKWITKNGVHIPITNDYMNDKIRNKRKKDIVAYRAGTTYGQKESGTFLAKNKDEAYNYGDDVNSYVIDKNANLYKGVSSYDYAQENNLLDVKSDFLKEKLGASTLREIEEIFDEGRENTYYDENPNLYFFAFQYMAKEDLEKKGYDGAFWKVEDDLINEQYQIWNNDVLKRR